MKKFIAVVTITLFSISASAYDMGLGVGFRTNDADSKVAGSTIDGVNGLQVGGIVHIDLTEILMLRSGFMYTQRNYEFKTGVASVDIELAYVDVPVTLMYKIQDYGGVFGGVNVALKVSDDCGPSECEGIDSTSIPITFGGYFKVAPQVGLEVFYESLSGDVSDQAENATSVGANVLVTFE